MNKSLFVTLIALCLCWGANAQLNINFEVIAPSCDGFTNGRITTTVVGGTAPYNYAWNTGATTATIFSVSAGEYTLTVNDADGNTASQSVTVSAPTPIQADITTAGSVCDGAATIYTASASGGTAPYTYAWSNGQTGNTFNPETEEVYYLTITDANGCTKTLPLKVQQPLMVNVITIGTRCPNFCDASAEAEISGGLAPYTFLWNTGATDQILSTLPAGTYTVTVTDANGCQVTGTGVAGAASDIEFSVDVNGTCGSGDVSATVNAQGGNGDIGIEWSTGDIGASVSGLTPGETYSVTVTDAAACTKREEFTVPIDDALVIDLVGENLACGAVIGGAATVTPLGGTAPYSIIWSNGELSETTIENLSAGDYSVTVIDANGCRGEASVTITASQGLNLEVESTPAICGATDADGMANVVPSGGTEPYTYAWSDGQSTGTAVGLEAGSYRVTVTDAVGCEGLANVTVEETVNIEPNATIDQAASSATVMPSGGTAPYTIVWSNGQTGDTATDLVAGECYQVSITDANNCTTAEEVCIPTQSVDVVVDVTPACPGETGMASLNIIGGIAPYTIEWSNGIMGSTSLDNLEAGTYSVIVTDANGNQRTRFFDILAVDLDIMGSTSAAACGVPNSGSARVQVLNPTSDEYTYAWSDGQTTATATNLEPGTYMVTVTSPEGCTNVNQMTVESGELDLQVLATSNVDCDGNLGTISVAVPNAEGITYTWEDGETGAERADLAAATYIVTATDATGCTAMQSITITEAEMVAADFELVQTAMNCETGRITLQAIDASTGNVNGWEWKYNDEVITGQDNISFEIDPSVQDMVNVQLSVTSADGCTSIMGEAYTTMEFALDVTATAAVDVCTGEAVVVEVVNNNPDQNLMYQWMPTNLFEAGTETMPNPTFIGTENTQVSVVVTNEMGCSFEQSIPVNIMPIFTPDLTNALTYEESCLGMIVNFTGTSDLEGYTWDFGDANNAGVSTGTLNPTFTYSEVGEYILTVTPGEDARCQAATSIPIMVDGPQELEFEVTGATEFCSDGTTLTVNDEAFTAVRWYSADDLDTPVSTEPSFDPMEGDYIVEVENAEGCTGRQEVSVVDRSVNLEFERSQMVCEGEDLQIDISNIEEALSVVWSPNDPLLIDDINSLNPIFTVDETTTFTATVTNEFGCTVTETLTIEVSESPNATVSAEMDSLFLGQETGLLVEADGEYIYTWDREESLDREDIADPTARPDETTLYNVMVTNEDGCSTVETIEIVVLPDLCDRPNIFIPNAFTPNEDGINDLLYVRGAHIDELYFVVHNRWGEMVFETRDQSRGWDGSYNGNPATGDAFGYYLEVTCYDGTVNVLKGNVTILK